MIIRAIKLGFNRTIKEKRLIFYLWAIQAFLASSFTCPFLFLLKKNFAHSWLATNLSRGVDLIWLGDLIYNNRNLPAFIAGLGLSLILLAVPISLGIDGGILAALKSDICSRFSFFLEAATRYFYRLLKIFLIFLLSLFIILLPVSRLLSSIFSLWTEKAGSAWPGFWAGLIKIFLLLIIYSLLRMLFEYSRLTLILEDSRKVLPATVRTANLIFSRFFTAWAVFFLPSIASMLLTFFFFSVLRLMPTTNLPSFWLNFILGEIYIFLRLALKFFNLGSCFYWANLAIARNQSP